MKPERIFHVTLTKCGSQWVRDVLTSPAVLEASGFAHVTEFPHRYRAMMQVVPGRTLYAPVYGMNVHEWNGLKRSGDKAIVVVRDPRDRLVSELFAFLYSHTGTPFIEHQRELLFRWSGAEDRLRFILADSRDMTSAFYLTWMGYRDSDALIVRYEDLVREQYAEFERIIDWCGWSVCAEGLRAVVERFSFERVTERRPGSVDAVSHHRRGLPGDWKNHFTRTLGAAWEGLYPGLLVASGYEDKDEWWRLLPDHLGPLGEDKVTPEEERIRAQKRRIAILEKQLLQKEAVLQDLAKAAAERLRLIEELDLALKTIKNHAEE